MKLINDLLTYFKISHRGRFQERLNEQFQNALHVVQDSNDDTAKAVMTITFSIQRVGDKIDLCANVTTKLYADKPFKSDTAWLDSGNISLQHPNQNELFQGPRDISTR